MTKAFVFGKFLPFHKGHERLIDFALTKCDFLMVLVCCSDKEYIPGDARVLWIKKTFEGVANMEVIAFNYQEDELPNTSISSEHVSEIWSDVFRRLLPGYSVVITSEAYGHFIARAMNIAHIPFGIARHQVPVSATAIRTDLFSNWEFLPECVKPFFALKVVILGTESTGKTTLAQNLSQYYNCGCVSEAGRDLIADSNEFTYEDLLLVASEHARRIDRAVVGNSPLIIIDTDIHITMSYAIFSFNRELEVQPEIYNSNKADLYIYLDRDAVYFQDGTRFDETTRDLLDLSHKKVLRDHNVNFVEITGSWDDRMMRSVELINEYIAAKTAI